MFGGVVQASGHSHSRRSTSKGAEHEQVVNRCLRQVREVITPLGGVHAYPTPSSNARACHVQGDENSALVNGHNNDVAASFGDGNVIFVNGDDNEAEADDDNGCTVTINGDNESDSCP